MVGVTMLLTIAICVGASTTIYARLTPLMSDFVSAKPKATATPRPSQAVAAVIVPTAVPTPVSAPTPPSASPTPAPSGTAAATAPAFQANYQVNGNYRVNFRSVPSSADPNTIIEGLAPGTPLQYTGTDDSSSGTRWMKFKLKDGTEGWIREIDVEQITSGQ